MTKLRYRDKIRIVDEEEEEFIQNRTRAGARFPTRWDQEERAKQLAVAWHRHREEEEEGGGRRKRVI